MIVVPMFYTGELGRVVEVKPEPRWDYVIKVDGSTMFFNDHELAKIPASATKSQIKALQSIWRT